VMAWAIDRLGRSLSDLPDTIQHLEACGVELYLDQQTIDTTTPMGKLVFQLTGAFAEFEPTMIRQRIKAGVNRTVAQGVNPGGSFDAKRRSFNKDFLLGLAVDFKKHGADAIEKVRKQNPAAYMKICSLLVPREMKLEHSGGVKAMTTEQLERGIEIIKELIAKRDAAANAKVIEGEAEVVPSLPAPGSGGTKMPKAKVSLSKSP